MKIETMQDLVDALRQRGKALLYPKYQGLDDIIEALQGKAIVPVELLFKIYERGDDDLLYQLEPYLFQASQEKDNG